MPKQIDWTEGEDAGQAKRPRKGPGRPRSARPKETGSAERSRAGADEEAQASAAAAREGVKRGSTGEGAGAAPATAPEIDPTAFNDVGHLEKKGLRVVPVVTGAVVDPAGTFLFYVDGHEDARSGVQAQLNHLLACGPSREEHLAPARARAVFLAEKLTKPRG